MGLHSVPDPEERDCQPLAASAHAGSGLQVRPPGIAVKEVGEGFCPLECIFGEPIGRPFSASYLPVESIHQGYRERSRQRDAGGWASTSVTQFWVIRKELGYFQFRHLLEWFLKGKNLPVQSLGQFKLWRLKRLAHSRIRAFNCGRHYGEPDRQGSWPPGVHSRTREREREIEIKKENK